MVLRMGVRVAGVVVQLTQETNHQVQQALCDSAERRVS